MNTSLKWSNAEKHEWQMFEPTNRSGGSRKGARDFHFERSGNVLTAGRACLGTTRSRGYLRPRLQQLVAVVAAA